MKNLYYAVVHKLIQWGLTQVEAITVDPRQENGKTVMHLHLYSNGRYTHVYFQVNFVDEKQGEVHKTYTFLKKLNGKYGNNNQG